MNQPPQMPPNVLFRDGQELPVAPAAASVPTTNVERLATLYGTPAEPATAPTADIPPPLVAVPVRSSWKSKEAWLFAASGVLYVLAEVFTALPPGFISSNEWIPAVMQMVAAASTVVGFFVRLSRPDLISGIPWFDKSTIRSVMAFPRTDPEKPVASPKAGA
jgi:hypothetical protein